MLWFIVLLSPLTSALDLRGPVSLGGPRALVGYPDASGGFYRNGIVPNVYSGYYPHQELERQRASDYRKGGQDGMYRNTAQNDHVKEIIRDAGGLASRDSDGWSGIQMAARGAAGSEGYYNDAASARFKQAANSAAGGATKYGTAGQDGFDGYGDQGHQKGHKTSGFQKSYHNIESGKDTKYVDEDHNTANQKHGLARDAAYGNSGWDARGHERTGGLHSGRAAYDAGVNDGSRSGAAHQVAYGSHDANGYHHNQDLAHKRRQEQAEDYRLARDGLHGMRARNGAIYHNELW